jgi:nitrogen fixation NifU-like protein
MKSDVLNIILNHYEFPNNRRKLDNFSVKASEKTPNCPDEIEIFLKIKDNIVIDAGFEGTGCTISQAITDYLLDYIKGKNIEEIKKLDKSFIEKKFGRDLIIIRPFCSTLGLNVVKKAIKIYEDESKG